MTERDDVPGLLGLLLIAFAALTAVLYVASIPRASESDAVTLHSAVACAEIAYVVALVLLYRVRTPTGSSIASGITFFAAGVFLLGELLWVGLAHVLGGRGGPGYSGIVAMHLLASVLVLSASAARGRRALRPFLGGIVLAAFGAGIVGSPIWAMSAGRHEARNARRTSDRVNQIRAVDAVWALTACALRQNGAEGDRGFPSTLAELPSGADCAGPPLDSRAVEGYTLSYTPRLRGANGRVLDFQLVAVPDEGQPDAGSVVADGRGLVFRVHDFPPSRMRSDTGAFIVHRAHGLGFVTGFRNMLRDVLDEGRARGDQNAPATVEEIATSDSIGRRARYIELVQRDSVYRVEYAAAEPLGSGSYGVSVTCVRYGTLCMRSYLLAPDGRTHATGAPRAARRSDPLLVAGEDGGGAVAPGVVGWGPR